MSLGNSPHPWRCHGHPCLMRHAFDSSSTAALRQSVVDIVHRLSSPSSIPAPKEEQIIDQNLDDIDIQDRHPTGYAESSSTSSEESSDDGAPVPDEAREWLRFMEERRQQKQARRDLLYEDETSVENYVTDDTFARHLFLDKYEGADALCILVMADEEHIYEVIRSALYHRFTVLGVREPIIGLTFGQRGHTLQVVIGWLDDAAPIAARTMFWLQY
ncbi:hypothetical protein BV25DRAFT_1528306 [Artomyces pyxidatus]|uniref:Uncharacterized protein n=1 Tax=Artomyces pyxidatus TaxID=48021 RepID=A0ACB8TBN6_9AGAM|nr:hypothetical protein BV25DRAFT_1528306 [Artomyces pyxidatus]